MFEVLHGLVGDDPGDVGHGAQLGCEERLVGVMIGDGDPEQVVGSAEHAASIKDLIARLVAPGQMLVVSLGLFTLVLIARHLRTYRPSGHTDTLRARVTGRIHDA